MPAHTSSPLSQLRALARDVVAERRTLADASVAAAALQLGDESLRAACATIPALLLRQPRYAESLARLTYALSERAASPPVQAQCALALAIVCNFLSHFAEAITLSARVVELESALALRPLSARAWLHHAWAANSLGELQAARDALAQARALQSAGDPLTRAQTLLVAGKIEGNSNHYAEAIALLARAQTGFVALGNSIQAARCLMFQGMTWIYQDAKRALKPLSQARRIFTHARSAVDVALCDYTCAIAFYRTNRYQESQQLYRRSARTFRRVGAPLFAAYCEGDLGLSLVSFGRHAEAEAHLLAARDLFSAHQSRADAVRTELNLGWLYKESYRASEALSLLQPAAAYAQMSGRAVRAARCDETMAAAYRQLGQYEKSLSLLLRARATFEAQSLWHDVATCDEDLGYTYQKLSLNDQAQAAYARALAQYADLQLSAYTARCEMRVAEFHIAQSAWAEAQAALLRARPICVAQKLSVAVAECDRLLAEVALRQSQWAEAREHLKRARAKFKVRGLASRLALCDLLAGELCLAAGATSLAQRAFERARRTLAPIMPDEAWRAEDGLGRSALQRRDGRTALQHFMRGVRHIQKVRAPLPTERLSAAYFSGRNATFATAFQLAIEQQAWADALTVSDAAKTSTFNLFLHQRGRPLRANASADPHVAALIAREAQLRQQLGVLYAKLDPTRQVGKPQPSALRGETVRANAEQSTRLKQLNQEHEHVVEQLRMAAGDGDGAAQPLSLDALRATLSASDGDRWLCLAYHFVGDVLHSFTLTAAALAHDQRTLTPAEQRALRKCTDPDPQMRELVYRGTLGGRMTNPTLGTTYLRRLYDLLIPPDVRLALDALDLLVVVPAGRLHGLPFHALRDADTYLVERVPLAYAPSLQALGRLSAVPPVDARSGQALIVGLSDFGERARPLPYAQDEVTALSARLSQRAHVLCNADASADALLRLNEQDELARYGLLHFATHSIVQHDLPLQSRILLHDGDLTAADILDLRLGRALVTLSSCESGGGEVQHGDELLNLARVFFYAGAQTLVASQWSVADRETHWLMREFYAHLLQGQRPARALQQAQIALHRAHAAPYHWAAFSVIGQA